MQSTNEPAVGARQGSGGNAPLIWGIVAGVLAVLAVIRLPMAAVFVFALLVLALVAGVVAAVLGVLALRRPQKRAGSLVGIVLGAAAIVVAGIGFTLALSGASFGAVSQVELRASSDSAFTIAYADDVQERSATSTAGEWQAMFGTRQAATEMTVTADEVGTVRCQIIRDGDIVAEESSDSGTVTCSVGDSQ
ncbi:hypothetical protein [Microbacterium sp. WCS2018Hpa-9]|uniref:hypothetical protein n=1 Tax=Microbacterium sp. WCS2018Hpa-9 TaxID=3073635 RepID=UPI00288B7358|nr:hypothetical protein [Microbacterium sp. WCS2018Hpa-9]